MGKPVLVVPGTRTLCVAWEEVTSFKWTSRFVRLSRSLRTVFGDPPAETHCRK